jgi:hypothetical protein
MMRPIESGKTARRTWQSPAVTKLTIGTKKKSSRENGQPKLTHPLPPVAPTTKLGFAFEMSIPLSARTSE